MYRNALVDLDEPVYSRLFTAEWEGGEQIINILTATVQDYFQDISHWLPEYFYSKFVHEVFVTVVGTYCMTIRKLANGAFRFVNELVAAARVVRDRDILLDFFEKYEFLLSRAGKDKKIVNLPPRFVTYYYHDNIDKE